MIEPGKSTLKEEIKTQSGVRFKVEKRVVSGHIEILLHSKNIRDGLLYWGLTPHRYTSWQIPPKPLWPEGSKAIGQYALQTPFITRNGVSKISIRLDKNPYVSAIAFALYFPDMERWDNNLEQNYHIDLSNILPPLPEPFRELQDEIAQKDVRFAHVYYLDDEQHLAIFVTKKENHYVVNLITDMPGPLILHWGIARHKRYDWTLPPASIRPPQTVVFKKIAAQTTFLFQMGLNRLRLELSEDTPLGIPFVLRHQDTGAWFNNHGRNFYIPLRPHLTQQKDLTSAKHLSLAEEMIQAEMETDSWTLMHRFNLCYDLLDNISNDLNEWALIYVWLRFSAIRQLTWQKNYNTQPRALSFAMDRLTMKLASIHIRSDPGIQEFIRLILTTLGRGGEGQRIRDEFLNIMHRHKIKEVAGTFMEEWHQKIHNNATPDDIVICEAYLGFLRNGGNLDLFYTILQKGGVSKERLKGFERPIVANPEFYPDIKEGLIHDLEAYLKVLKSVHSGTDLESALQTTRHLLDHKTQAMLQYVWLHRYDSGKSLLNIVEKITNIRSYLKGLLTGNEDFFRVRDLLFLDLSLEAFLRVFLERHIHAEMDKTQLVNLITFILKNLNLSYDDLESLLCMRHWERIMEIPRFDKDWALHAKSILDRVGRTVGAFIDRYHSLIQPEAEFLGRAFHADPWTIPLFTEEVVRGRPIFILSLLLRHIDPLLRNTAHLGNWQIISPGRGTGWVKVVDKLRQIQGKTFLRPTIIIADKITGDEEIPDGVTALITPEITDIVSHIAVRSRNKNVFFATCYDTDTINYLKSLNGEPVSISTDGSGDVVVQKGSEGQDVIQDVKQNIQNPKIASHDRSLRAISLKGFTDRLVGGKSYHLKRLQSKKPSWIHLPRSVALPFGVFEGLMNEPPNKRINKQYQRLVSRIDEDPIKTLEAIRKLLLGLKSSETLVSSLHQVMDEAGLKWPENWETAWTCIKRIWASKWNERAYWSRRSMGISHHDIVMAILIQEVVEADYAFVIHTTNPCSKNSGELYGELVLGLGETLVGNYPGRAFGFTSKKDAIKPNIMAYPSKSVGLYGRGLIFRSDSSGEDLSGYAGAGLYDSVILEAPREALLDYTKEPLLWDEGFRSDLFAHIVKIGIEVERAFDGCPQDIEGVYSKGEYYVVQARPQVGLKA